MRAAERYFRAYGNESAETRGTELERAYAKILDGEVTGKRGDGGCDIIFEENKKVPLVQVKSSWTGAEESLDKSRDFKVFLPLVVGDPGQYSKEDIFDAIEKNGGFVGIDVDGGSREELMEFIKFTRDQILSDPDGKMKAPFKKRS